MVTLLGFAAVGAAIRLPRYHIVVGTPLVTTGFRGFLLWDGHGRYPKNKFLRIAYTQYNGLGKEKFCVIPDGVMRNRFLGVF
jgi:hypothetical protein